MRTLSNPLQFLKTAIGSEIRLNNCLDHAILPEIYKIKKMGFNFLCYINYE